MPILIIITGIIVLLLLIMWLRLNAFLALIMVSLGVGVALGMDLTQVAGTIKKGVGDTLGELALVLGFGAMLGGIIAESGAARVITTRMIDAFGRRWIAFAMVLTGFIVGIPLFYSVGFLMVIPLIFAVANQTKLPILYVGIPMVSALSVTHGFLPPHPAPTAIAIIYKADIPLTLMYGIIIAIPSILIAGPLFARTFKNKFTPVSAELFKMDAAPEGPQPGFAVGVFTALTPVLLMGLAAITQLTLPKTHIIYGVAQFIGDPVIAMLLAVLISVYTLGIKLKKSMTSVMEIFVNSVKSVAMILLIIGGGGAFKQVLVDSGAGDYLVKALEGLEVSPLLLAWMIAAALRIALGSATIAALTAAGIVAPLVASTNVNPELLVLATGAGSLTCSQVNDTGFWLFKEYFNLSIPDTLRSWTAMETIISIVGLAGCLLLNQIVG